MRQPRPSTDGSRTSCRVASATGSARSSCAASSRASGNPSRITEISRLNQIRANHPALQNHLGLRFYHASDDAVLYFARFVPTGATVTRGQTDVAVDLARLGVDQRRRVSVGAAHQVRLAAARGDLLEDHDGCLVVRRYGLMVL